MNEGMPALFRRYPAVRERLPWLRLATLPTPVERLELGAGGPDAELWIKRDDRSGTLYGGNKVRKLEFLLARARRRDVTRLITVGAAGSHHALATAAYGRALGFHVTLVLFPQPFTDHVRRVLLQDHALGAEIRWTPRMELVPLELMRARRAHHRERVGVIKPGGSDPVGTLGYVSAGLELAEQVADGALPRPATVHVAAGTLGTAAGLALGFTLAGLEARIRAVRITGRLVANERVLRRLVMQTARLLQHAGAPAPPADDALARIELCHEWLGLGYGHATEAGRAAAGALATAGITLDATYTAKAAADALAAAPERGSGPRLFWNTLSASEPELAADGADRIGELPRPIRRYLESAGESGGGAGAAG